MNTCLRRIAIAAALTWIGAAFAADEETGPSPGDAPAAIPAETPKPPAASGLSEAQRKAVITENIVFGKDEADGFWPLYRDYRRDVSKLQDQRAKAIVEYAEVFRTMTTDQAKSILEGVLQADEGIVKLKRDYQKKFRKFLPETKVTRVFVIDAKIDLAGEAMLMTRVPTAEPRR